MEYQKIDLSTWDRGELFAFYIEKMRIVMSLTVDVDVAPLAAFVHQNGLKFYPAMIWTVSRVINAHDEFKYGWDDSGSLIRWNQVWLHVFDEGKFLAPVVTWGRFEKAEGGKLLMPLTMNIHHAAADGFHLSRFFSEVQEQINVLGTGGAR